MSIQVKSISLNNLKCLGLLLLINLVASLVLELNAQSNAKVDSMFSILKLDTISDRTRVKTAINLVRRLKYQGEHADSLLTVTDSICEANGFDYLRQRNLFNRTVSYNHTRGTLDSYLSTLRLMDSLLLKMEDRRDLNLWRNKAYANYYHKRREYDKAEQSLLKAIKVLDSLNIEKYKASYYTELALNQKQGGKYYDAIENYLKALEYKNVKKSYAYHNIARLYGELYDYESQYRYAEQGRLAAIEENRLSVQISNHLEVGVSLFNQQKYDEAEAMFFEALPLISKSTIPHVRQRAIIVYQFLMHIYNKDEEWDKTINLESAIDTLLHEWSYATAAGFLGAAYLAKGEVSKAKEICLEGKKIALEFDKYLLEPCRCLAKIYQVTGQHQKANNHLLIIDSLENIINDKDKLASIAKALAKKDLKQQADLLAVEQARKEESYRSKLSLQRIVLISISIILGLIAASLIQLRKRKRKIESQNKIISEALNEKDVLLREVHHRVKNNLQVISSLLNLQARDIKSESTKEIFNASKERVHSMALIHENLQLNNESGQIDIDSYLRKLSKQLVANNLEDSTRVQFNFQIDKIYISMDKMIALGLIMNEILLGKIKAAKSKNQSSKIAIILNASDNEVDIKISDSLEYLAADAKETDISERIIRANVQKLKAKYYSSKEEGNMNQITFKI